MQLVFRVCRVIGDGRSLSLTSRPMVNHTERTSVRRGHKSGRVLSLYFSFFLFFCKWTFRSLHVYTLFDALLGFCSADEDVGAFGRM